MGVLSCSVRGWLDRDVIYIYISKGSIRHSHAGPKFVGACLFDELWSESAASFPDA